MASYPPYNKSKAKLKLSSVFIEDSDLVGTSLELDSYPGWYYINESERVALFAPVKVGLIDADPVLETGLSVVWELSQGDDILGYTVSFVDTDNSIDLEEGFILYNNLTEEIPALHRWHGRITKLDMPEDKNYMRHHFVVTGSDSCVAHVIPSNTFEMTTLKSAGNQ